MRFGTQVKESTGETAFLAAVFFSFPFVILFSRRREWSASLWLPVAKKNSFPQTQRRFDRSG